MSKRVEVRSEGFIAGSHLGYTITHEPGKNRWLLCYCRNYGMAVSQDAANLNSSTPISEPFEFTSKGRPLIWLDTDLDRLGCGPPAGVFEALLASETAVIKDTGMARAMTADYGGETQSRTAHLVEILLSEEQLTRVCYYCGVVETADCEPRWTKISGEGYMSTYQCSSQCASKRYLYKTFQSVWRRFTEEPEIHSHPINNGGW